MYNFLLSRETSKSFWRLIVFPPPSHLFTELSISRENPIDDYYLITSNREFGTFGNVSKILICTLDQCVCKSFWTRIETRANL